MFLDFVVTWFLSFLRPILGSTMNGESQESGFWIPGYHTAGMTGMRDAIEATGLVHTDSLHLLLTHRHIRDDEVTRWMVERE